MLTRTAAEQDAIYAKLKARDAWAGPNNPPVVLISAELAHNEARDNSLLTAELEDDLINSRLPFKRVLGAYYGREERTFAVVLSTDSEVADKQYARLLELANQYNQESILYLSRDRHATLHYTKPNTPRTALGRFKPVSKEHALQCHSWTYDVDQDTYFTTE